MKQELDPFEMIAGEVGISPGEAEHATRRFLQWLSRSIQNYDEGNRDFIGEELHWKLNRATFYHLLGLFDEFSHRYSWQRGSASQYLLRIAPREEWPSYDDGSIEPPKPDAEVFLNSMRQICELVFDSQFDIKLVVCDLNSRLYARIRVSEEMFPEDHGFTMIDYVPLTPADFPALIGLKDRDMLLRLQKISKGRDGIHTTRGKACWSNFGVFYPHT